MNKVRLGVTHEYTDEREFRSWCEAYFHNNDEDSWTISGLSLHLGLTTQQMTEMAANDDGLMGNVLRQALTVLEADYEKRMKRSGKDYSFALKRFGWSANTDAQWNKRTRTTVMPQVMVTDGQSIKELTFNVGEETPT